MLDGEDDGQQPQWWPNRATARRWRSTAEKRVADEATAVQRREQPSWERDWVRAVYAEQTRYENLWEEASAWDVPGLQDFRTVRLWPKERKHRIRQVLSAAAPGGDATLGRYLAEEADGRLAVNMSREGGHPEIPKLDEFVRTYFPELTDL